MVITDEQLPLLFFLIPLLFKGLIYERGKKNWQCFFPEHQHGKNILFGVEEELCMSFRRQVVKRRMQTIMYCKICNPGTPFQLIKRPISWKNAPIYAKQTHLNLQDGPVVIVTESFAERNRSQMFSRLGFAALTLFSLQLADFNLVETNVMDIHSGSVCAWVFQSWADARSGVKKSRNR